MKIRGTIIQVLPVKTGVSKNGNQWQSVDFIVEYSTDKDNKYPKRICMNVFGQDRINGMTLNPGLRASFWFDVEAKEYNGRWFNSVSCYKMSVNDNELNESSVQNNYQPQQPQQQQYNQNNAPFPQSQNVQGYGNNNGGVPF